VTIAEATKIALDILPPKVLALHLKDKENSEQLYALIAALIFNEARGKRFTLRSTSDAISDSSR
jgi:hypothetical protein